MKTENYRRVIRAQMDLMSDSHQEIVDLACEVTGSIITLEEAATTGRNSNVYLAAVDSKIDVLVLLLESQEHRLVRIREEMGEIQRGVTRKK